MVIRTRFYDEYLLTAAMGGIGQVVLLAAGLDARAFRLRWPEGVRLYELDLPDVLAFNDLVLSGQAATPRCRQVTVAVDLRGDWSPALCRGGFDPSQPAVRLAEGRLIYLSADEAASLLSSVGAVWVTGSRIAFEIDNPAADPMGAQAAQVPAMRPYAQLWKGGCPTRAAGWPHAAGASR